MERRGLGDRWLAGEQVPGVEFAHYEPVRITAGRFLGQVGTIALLIDVGADPEYVVSTVGGDVRVRQSSLAPARD
jgi:hypothetical protein